MNRRHDRQYLLAALVFLGVASVAVQSIPGAAAVSSAAGRVLTPVQRGLSGAALRVQGLVSGSRDLEVWQARAIELEEENAHLETDNLRLTSLEREVRDLREGLGFKDARPDLDLMGASIVGTTVAHEPGHLTRAIKLDVGRADGVAPRMTVASPRGLVGQVVRVTDHWSNVLLITDPSSAVAGRIDRSREAGMVFGSPSGEVVMRYIPQDRPDAPPNVQVGDLVYTSGQSERFAPRLLVGQVTEVRQNDFETFQEAVIRPSVDLNAIETVLIVTAWLPRDDEAPTDLP